MFDSSVILHKNVWRQIFWKIFGLFYFHFSSYVAYITILKGS